LSSSSKTVGAILNKCLEGENPAEQYCREEGIHILGKIPFDSRLGALNADSKIAVREDPAYYEMFGSLLRAVMGEVRHEANAHSQR
jgi:MinD superfamily P-loop ATPase